MKTLLRFSFALFSVVCLQVTAQTLYVPSGTVGTSSTGNVGIGTSSPSRSLSIEQNEAVISMLGQIGHTMVILDNNGTASNFSQIRYSNNGTAYFAAGIDPADGFSYKIANGLNVNVNPRVTVTTDGNVGIGTTSPARKLTVQGDLLLSDGQHGSLMGHDTYTGGRAFLVLDIDSTDGVGSGSDYLYLAQESGRGVLASAFGTPLELGSDTTQMTILPNGNVGVGTTNPLSKLHVQGIGRFGLNDVSTNNIGGILVASGTGVGGARQYWIGASDPTAHNNNNFEISDYNGATNSPLLTILGTHNGATGGNVGIGTTNPTQKLSVNGTIQAKEVLVQTGWSDYVFADDYRLAPLSEVESHIKAEKHLPGIPSAAEVASEGVSLGNMQAKLLAKIEELTLHQIEQEKRLNEQAARLQRLEQENAALRRGEKL